MISDQYVDFEIRFIIPVESDELGVVMNTATLLAAHLRSGMVKAGLPADQIITTQVYGVKEKRTFQQRE